MCCSFWFLESASTSPVSLYLHGGTLSTKPSPHFPYWKRSHHLLHLLSQILRQINVSLEFAPIYINRKHMNNFKYF